MAQNNDKIEIKETGKYGQGVYVKEKINKGEVIWDFEGEEITLAECLKRVAAGTMSNDDGLQIGEELYLSLDPVARSFNHSCEPNSGLTGRSTLIAIRDIEVGEEVVYDYSTTVGGNISPEMWTMECSCGSKKCRKVLSNVLSLPKETIERYESENILQDFIKQELSL